MPRNCSRTQQASLRKILRNRMKDKIESPVQENSHFFYKSKFFIASPCNDCDLPGYFILEPLEKVCHLFDLGSGAKSELGVIFPMLEKAILEVTGAERIYVLRFSEGMKTVHFHFFPRTRSLAEAWLRSNSSENKDGALNGELLFGWARKNYRVDRQGDLSPVSREAARLILGMMSTTDPNP